MDIDKIETEIMERQEGVSALSDDLAGIEMDLKKKKKILAEALLKNKSKERKPSSLTVQKRSVADLGVEAEGLQSAIEILENEVKSLELEKGVAQLYQTQGRRFLKAVESCEKAHKQASDLSKVLQDALGEFSALVDTLISATSTARQGYAQILRDLPVTFSLRDFEAGKIQEAGDTEIEDREKAAGDLNKKLLELSQISAPSDETQIAAFVESARKLSQWKTFVAGSDINIRHDFRYREVRPDRPLGRPLQPGDEKNRYIIQHPEQYPPREVARAREEIANSIAKGKAAREKGLEKAKTQTVSRNF